MLYIVLNNNIYLQTNQGVSDDEPVRFDRLKQRTWILKM